VRDGWLYHEETHQRIELFPVIGLSNTGA
ncbi:peptide deformylase, partial [Clostridium perfringens]